MADEIGTLLPEFPQSAANRRVLEMTLDRALTKPEFSGRPRGEPEADRPPPPSVRWWILAKQTTLALLLVVAFLAYYLFGALIEAMSLL